MIPGKGWVPSLRVLAGVYFSSVSVSGYFQVPLLFQGYTQLI